MGILNFFDDVPFDGSNLPNFEDVKLDPTNVLNKFADVPFDGSNLPNFEDVNFNPFK